MSIRPIKKKSLLDLLKLKYNRLMECLGILDFELAISKKNLIQSSKIKYRSDNMSYGIMRADKAKTWSEITHKELHNTRGKEVKNADGTKNIEVEGMTHVAKYLKATEKALDKQNGRKTRSDAVRCVEFVFTSDKQFFERVRYKEYFEECDKWLKATFGIENVLQKTIHLDESTPHVHFLVSPIFEGKFNCKHWIKGKGSLRALQDSFHASVKHLGLERGNLVEFTKDKHQSALQFAEDVSKAKEYISQLSHEELVNYAIAGLNAKEVKRDAELLSKATKALKTSKAFIAALKEHYRDKGYSDEQIDQEFKTIINNYNQKQKQKQKSVNAKTKGKGIDWPEWGR